MTSSLLATATLWFLCRWSIDLLVTFARSEQKTNSLNSRTFSTFKENKKLAKETSMVRLPGCGSILRKYLSTGCSCGSFKKHFLPLRTWNKLFFWFHKVWKSRTKASVSETKFGISNYCFIIYQCPQRVKSWTEFNYVWCPIAFAYLPATLPEVMRERLWKMKNKIVEKERQWEYRRMIY